MRDTDTKAILDSIGANLRRFRLRAGLTQEALAERAGTEIRFTQRVERGKIDISISTLVRLARALHVAPSAFLRRAKLAAPRPGRPPRQTKR